MATKRSQHLTAILPRTCARCGLDISTHGLVYASTQPILSEESGAPKLSFRERQIVQLIQQARTNKEIAHELSLTVGTVKEYLYHIFRKLGVTNRTELALRRGENRNASAGMG
jgi:DNA-binding NarL/FixJ family response regulator